jgi:hypothetical protein
MKIPKKANRLTTYSLILKVEEYLNFVPFLHTLDQVSQPPFWDGETHFVNSCSSSKLHISMRILCIENLKVKV